MNKKQLVLKANIPRIHEESEYKHFVEYIKKYRWQLVLSCAALLLVYGAWMFNSQPNIDKEVFINYPESFYNWLDIGRQGLIATEYLLGLRWFSPYFSTSVGYVFLCIAGILFGYVFWRISARKSIICACFALLYFCSPVFVEQFYFDLQLIQIAWAYILCVIGVGFSFFGILRNSKAAKILAVFCMVWSFCSYQTFILLHVSAVILGFLILYYRWSVCGGAEVSEKKYWKLILWQIGLFALAMAINTIVTQLFFANGDYLNNQRFWGILPNSQCIDNILRHVYDGFLGNGIFYSIFYGLSALGVLAVVLLDCIQSRGVKLKWLYFLAAAGLQLCPFLLTVYMGNAPTMRSQLAYPFILVCNFIFLSSRKWNALGYALVAAMVVCSVWSQSAVSVRLIYTDNLRAQEDMRLLQSIEMRVQTINASDKPIAIVGAYSNRLNAACVRGEVIGVSIFSFDYPATPHYYWSTRRVCMLASTQGYTFNHVSEEQMLEARKIAFFMPSWPHTDSVQDVGDFVIVKLGEDSWPEELSQN